MTEPQNRQEQPIDRILEQSLPKPGVAEAMRFWHYTRPLRARHPTDTEEYISLALSGELSGPI
ncbi:MAG: hypothetical protein OXB99_17805 [Acidimicrobiaceae bacterium]|nr:hypothetical protein [Acidimicrobiaceae bacterium]